MSGLGSASTDDPLASNPRGLTRSGDARLEAIDLLRGLVIAIMVLDHVRDFFHSGAFTVDPLDPATSVPVLYLTRWVTHICAPTFVLLSGVSIYLQQVGGKTGATLSRFLVTRGLWLVFLELTIIMFAWNFGPAFWLLQVIWVIGWSMVGMAAVVHFGPKLALVFGILLVSLSPLARLEFAPASTVGEIGQQLLFGMAPIAGAPVMIAYAIVPWFGIMAIGYGLGPLFALGAAQRAKRLTWVALGLISLFFLLRTANGFGNPTPWQGMDDPVRTAMSYFNVNKYPPSPDFVSIMLGISLLLFVGLAHLRGPIARVLGDFGRTPLFTYIAHLYIAHALMLAAAIAVGNPGAAIAPLMNPPVGWGWGLAVVYGVWLLVLAILVPLARWMANLKRNRRDWWLSYI